jgi:bifunctional NMN adenylyltransferase/nudix hydrolase
MARKFDYLLYMGRFQPLHLGHINTFNKAFELADKVIVMCGSAYQPRTPKNPWTVKERWEMIRKALPNIDPNRVVYTFSYDYLYNDQRWVEEVQSRMKALTFPGDKIGIIGCKKDASSYYLDLFPQWELVEMDKVNIHHATNVRICYFEDLNLESMNALHPATIEYLKEFKKTPEYDLVKAEYDHISKYKAGWKESPYPPIFFTVDAVVIQSGHVLLVKRNAQPGKGNYALPGGFLDPNEYVLDGVIRELREETKLKVPVPVLKGSIKGNKIFDHPDRSLRGRTITNAFFIELVPGPLHEVKGGDDAEKAVWIPLADIDGLRDKLFEDHADIISYFLGGI